MINQPTSSATCIYLIERACKHGILALTLLLISACGSNAEPNGEASDGGVAKAVEIVPYTVALRPETLEVQAVGTARAEKSAIIRADQAGDVTHVYFQGGERVKKGDVLITLELDEESLAVDRARVAVKDAEQLNARFAGMKVPGAISDSRIDEVKIAAERAKIELKLAEITLEERQVRAPFSGTVGLTDIDPGARITPETEITQLDDRTILYIDFQAPEEVYGRIAIGDVIQMEPFANLGKIHQAKIYKIDSRISQASRSFTVRTQLNNTDDTLRPGMSFKVDFQLPGRSYPAVPEAAIIWGGDGAYIWVAEDGLAKQLSVTIVGREDGLVLVRAPLAEGSVIIAEGVQKVREGTSVEPSTLYGTKAKDKTSNAPVKTDSKETAPSTPVIDSAGNQ